MSDDVRSESDGRLVTVGRIFGPLVFVGILFLPSGALGSSGLRVAAVGAWMAIWWVTEAVPLAITSMLPLVLFPLMAVRSVRDVAPNYADNMIFLFFGGFVLALAVERSSLHKRVALATLHTVGGSPRRLVWGFLIVTAALSMWLSNTATTLMLLPIGMAVASRIEDPKTPVRMLLAIAFGASIGGLGTLVGTPPNLVLAGMAPNLVPNLPPLTFGAWMLLGVPLVIVLLPVAGLLLGRGLPRTKVSTEEIQKERAALGEVSTAERRAAFLFVATALAWITRSGMSVGSLHIPGWASLLPNPKLVSDAVPAVAAAILATIIPTGSGRHRPLVTWDEVRHGVPWGVLLLFGGGFALADGVHASRLDVWLAGRLEGLHTLPIWAVVFIVVLLTAFVTNLTSNTATATLMMPVMAALAEGLHASPYLLMASATVAASCAFVLPVATPPNAIVMGSGRVTSLDLFREGILLNLIAVVITTVLCLLLAPLVLPA